MIRTIRRGVHLPAFKDLGLNTWLLDYLAQAKLHTPSAIQALAVPPLLSHHYHNFQITAQTGTGKTLAFLLPLFHNLKAIELGIGMPLTAPKLPSAIVLESSRQLVQQSAKVSGGIGHFCRLKSGAIGVFGRSRDKQQLLQGVDVMFSTVEAYSKWHERQVLGLTNLRILVIDEIDTLLDGGNEKMLLDLIGRMKAKQKQAYLQKLEFIPQVVMVSSTYTKLIDDFIRKAFHSSDPRLKDLFTLKKLVQRNAHLNLQNIGHEFVHCKELDKQEPLLQQLKQQLKGEGSVIIFCDSVSSVQSLDFFLAERGIKAVCLHGDVPKKIRQSNHQRFRARSVRVLISTDLGSRGLDFPFVDTVINFDFPKSTSDYLHRAGRTGRAGRPGVCISLYHKKHLPMIQQLKQSYDTKKPLDVQGSAYSLTKEKQEQVKTHKLRRSDRQALRSNRTKIKPAPRRVRSSGQVRRRVSQKKRVQ